MKKITTEEFIKRAKSIHGDLYCYDFTNYVNYEKHVSIVCKVHGVFSQSPDSHLQGKGCNKCGILRRVNARKLTIEELIKKAIEVHGDKYDYSLIDKYINNRTNVLVICKIHGIFKKMPNGLISGGGCPKCSRKHQYTTSEFIERAKEVHGDLYDYSMVSYKNARENILIICSKHGVFSETPTSHLNGCGCIRCGGRMRLTTNEFKERSIKIHGNKYIYDKVIYENIHKPVDIICSVHGVFSQIPNNHLMGKGCKKCNISKGERTIDSLLNYNELKFERQKTFSGCFNKKELKFDFYLPNHNMCIEYNGEQHYKSISYFGGNEKFRQLNENDEIKKKFCLENGIELIIIRYDENTEEAFNEKVLNSINSQNSPIETNTQLYNI